jgi:integrase
MECPVSIAPMDAAITALRRQRVTTKSPPRSRRPTDAEIDRVIAYHRGQRHARVDLPAILAVLRVLPFRIGELVKVESDDLIPEQQAVRLRARKHPDINVRESNDYVVPLPTITGIDTWALVADRPRFLPRPFPYASGNVSTAFSWAARRAHIEDLHLHDLRAFSISKLIEANEAAAEGARATTRVFPLTITTTVHQF